MGGKVDVMFGGILKEEMVIPPVVAVSGGFDPVHNGHIRLIREANKHGKVLVILNSDEWLVRKKGYAFMSWDQRAEILLAIKGVYAVVKAEDQDGTVCKTLAENKPQFFANGGDRTNENTPELETCAKEGIEPLFGIGGEKVASSSEMVKAANG